MNTKKLLQSKRRGSAVALALVAILMLLALGGALMGLGLNRRVYATRAASDIAARCAADAGLAVALFEMNEKLKVEPWDGSSLPEATDIDLPYCDAGYSYEVTGNLATGYTVESTGTSGVANRTVRATLGLWSPFHYGILTKGMLTLKSGTVVSSYNSLDSSDLDTDVVIGSQSSEDSTIVLNVGTIVNGNVVVPGNVDSAIKDLGATVTGGKYISPPDYLPQVTAPELSDKGSVSATKETVTLTAADSGTYSSIALQQSGILAIQEGDVVLHVTGDIELGNSCEITVAEGASLTIYSDGDIHCHNGSDINTESPPEIADTLQIYATGEGTQTFDIKAKSEFTGVIYAPDADVTLYANGDVYGAVVAGNFDFKAGGNFKYDKGLQQKDKVDDDAVQFVVRRWSESGPSFNFAMSP
ncbi:MAG: hypothetical protein P8Z79_02760 [Sedimentisphaerales bacterium]